jgi:four helix bundle protein
MALRVSSDIERIGKMVNVVCKQIGQHDSELASQIRRAWVRAGMNVGEAQHRRGAKGANRFDDAMGEAREAYTGIGMALAFEFVEHTLGTSVRREIDGVVAVLYRLAHKAPRR